MKTLKLWWVWAPLVFTLPIYAQPDSGDESPHKSGFITVNNVKLHYLDWGGAGEPLLFLHGMSGTAHFYDDFAPRFTNQFRVLGLTRRGHGESEMPETGYDTPTLVADIRQFLDTLKIQRVVLAGHSFAGDELTRFAAVYPDRVIKLIYFDSAYDHSRIPANLRWKPLHGVVPESLPTKEESESPDGGRRWVMRKWGQEVGRMIYSMIEGTYAETHEYGKIRAPTLAFFATGYCTSSPADSKCPGFDRKKVFDWIESLPEPQRKDAQEFVQAQQKYYEQEIEHFRREIPNGRTIVFTNADHVCFIDREADVLREMREFLNTTEGTDKSPHQSEFITAVGEPEPVLTDASLRQILEERIKAKKAVGLVVGRLQGTNRSIVAAGTMALNGSRPVDGDTVFKIGSVTKVFTGTLLADMANRGEVQPNDPATKYLPPTVKMPSRNGQVITLAQLASHRSGLPREPDVPADVNNPDAPYSTETVFGFLSRCELTRDPGSAYEYSNVGMGLLGELLARRAGTSYEQLVSDRICKPLGMNDTREKVSEEMPRRFATGHDYGLKPTKDFGRRSLAGAGSLRSTANDFLKFLAVVLNPGDDRVSKAIKASQTARTNAGVAGVEVAWGWHFNTVSDEIINHSGLTGGFHTFMGVNRKRNRAVVIFSNGSYSSDNIGMRLLDPRNQPDESTLERYVGTYGVTPTYAITVSRDKYDMYVKSNDDPNAEMFPLGRDQFYGPGFSLSFKTNTSGTVTELILRTQGQEHRAVRK